MYDLVIRGGTVVDGTGAAPRVADVAVIGGRIVAVGASGEPGGPSADVPAVETIDATGLVVTPGYVDVHTHYDGQVTWDPLLAPSCWHGVTTVVLGNCGVGFAPVRPDQRAWLVQLMEGVEDIPGTALHDGIRWNWESFPEYLDALDAMPRALDVAAQMPHGALRAYVMGERGADNEPATEAEIAEMAGLVGEAVAAGAIGFSTNRLAMHTAKDGRPVPGTHASIEELFAIGRAMAGAGSAVMEVISSEAMGNVADGYTRDVEWTSELSRETGLPITLCLTQVDNAPDRWREVLELVAEARAAGAEIVPQVAGRPLGILLGLSTKHQFQGRPSYEEIAHLPVADRARALADPERRARIMTETYAGSGIGNFVSRMPHKAFPLGAVPDYEPDPSTSVAAIAARTARSVDDVFYDLFCEHEGRQLVLFALGGYANQNCDHIHEMLTDSSTVLGLADGGAHCGLICDASVYTSMLSHWVRDRPRGARLTLEGAVAKMTSLPARLYGLTDRGVVAPGMKADLNLIDLGRLQLRLPEVVDDLPTGASRIVQRADGYVATIVTGQVVLRDGVHTGARPGRLVRGVGARVAARAGTAGTVGTAGAAPAGVAEAGT